MATPTYNQSTLTYNNTGTTYDGNDLGVTNMPVVGVFVSFVDGPYVVEPQWVEITQYVREINIKRGRENDLQQFPAGSANLTLDNRTRLFDPFNTAGTYYGNLKPRRQIKIVGQYAGVTYPIFRGYIAGFPVTYVSAGKDSTVNIDCFDLMGLLAAETLQGNQLLKYMLSLSPTYLMPLDQKVVTSETTNASGVVTQRISTYNNLGSAKLGGVTRNMFSDERPNLYGVISQQPSMIPAVDTQCVYREGSEIGTLGEDLSGSVASRNCSVVFWFSNERSVAKTFLIGGTNSRSFSITIDSSNRILAGFGSASCVTTTVISDNEPRMIAVTNEDNGTVSIYIDGINVSGTQTISTGNDFTFPLNYFRMAFNSPGWAEKYQYVAFYEKKLSASEISKMYNLARGSSIETIATRLSNYMSATSISSNLYSISPNLDVVVNEIETTNQSLLPVLDKTIKSEDGNRFVDASGILKFVDQQVWASNDSAIPQMTFTDTGTGVYYDYASLQLGYDADQVRNDIKIAGSFELVGTASANDSINSVGIASDTYDTAIAYKSDADSLANYLVTVYKNPKLRVEPFIVKGQRNPTYDWQRILSLELFDRFTIQRTPSVGSAVSQDMLLQSIEHRITTSTWETTINGSSRFTGWFIIGVSLIGGTDVLL